MKNILINATAATTGGALTILNQLLDNIPNNLNFIIFVSIDFNKLPSLENVKYVNPNVKSGLKRIYWDSYGFQQWCKIHNIYPDLILSLQNTGVRFDKNIQQVVYYHQLIPLFNYSWSFFKKEQRALWFYKNIYPLFVKQHVHENTIFITQFEWIKQALANNIGITREKIYVINPTIPEIDIINVNKINLPAKYNIFYPASNFVYKNHIEIVNAIYYLKEQNYDISGIKIFFTLDNDEKLLINKLITKFELMDNFEFIGNLGYADVLSYYKNCDLVVFPSYIETFGLPLVEAAKFGKKILASNLDYAREVLNGYDGVVYLPIHNSSAWGKAIYSSMQNKENFASWEPEFGKNSWRDFFCLINKFIKG